ncbi:MAG: hypothetical protein HAW67_02255 [Endozoicomonadaceae bacterium]|nr:hypothetical protein [Endozoicomonadaceae bacterium]
MRTYSVIHCPINSTSSITPENAQHALKLASKILMIDEGVPISSALMYAPLLSCLAETEQSEVLISKLNLKWLQVLTEHSSDECELVLLENAALSSNRPQFTGLNEFDRQLVEYAKIHGVPVRYIDPVKDSNSKGISYKRLDKLKDIGDTLELEKIDVFHTDINKRLAIHALQQIVSTEYVSAVIVESPFKGGIHQNVTYCYKKIVQMMRKGYLPFASHLMYTQFLDDRCIQERSLGIDTGLKLYPVCHEGIFLLERGFTDGMKGAYKYAHDNGYSTSYFEKGSLFLLG